MVRHDFSQMTPIERAAAERARNLAPAELRVATAEEFLTAMFDRDLASLVDILHVRGAADAGEARARVAQQDARGAAAHP